MGSSGPWMQECRCLTLLLNLPTHEVVVYCVSWLISKVHVSQWLEELRLVGYEIQWTVNWFQWKERGWMERLGNVTNEE